MGYSLHRNWRLGLCECFSLAARFAHFPAPDRGVKRSGDEHWVEWNRFQIIDILSPPHGSRLLVNYRRQSLGVLSVVSSLMIVPESPDSSEARLPHRLRTAAKSETGSLPISLDGTFSFSFFEKLSHLGVVSEHERARLPTFMVVSPPKTGTSWLYAILLHHPEVALPREKETRFFSSFYRWCDLRWYLSRFGDSARLHRGDATPTYAILPPGTIRLIHDLAPWLKVIFLLREPVERAWSHARHNWRYGEANFAAWRPALEQVTEAQWQENFSHPWSSVSGDYLGQLRRWRSVFPREQLYVGFFDDIALQPQKLLAEVFSFLGISPIDVKKPVLQERVNEGLHIPLSDSLLQSLRQVYGGRTRQLANYLRDEFGVSLPDAWSNTLAGEASASPELAGPMQVAAEHEFDNEFLARVVAYERPTDQPMSFADHFLGYNLFLFRDRVYALAGHLREGFLPSATAAEHAMAEHSGYCLNGGTVMEVKERIASRLVEHRIRLVA